MKKKKKFIPLLLLMLLWTSCFQKQNSVAQKDLGKYHFKNGDILFQHIPGYLTSVIADVTDSQYSHCGMVVYKGEKPYVLEAIGPVQYTPLLQWINRGMAGVFAQFRVKNLTDKKYRLALIEAEKMLGRPYDIRYRMDDLKIYCSELVYKAYLRGPKIKIGKLQKLGSLKWRPHEKFIRYLEKGALPLERMMITPEALTRSPHVELVYTTYPQKYNAPEYSSKILAGSWQGEYTVSKFGIARAEIIFSKSGLFKNGQIRIKGKQIARIEKFTYKPFKKEQSFNAELTDSRGFSVKLEAQIRDNGKKLIGTWKDNAGFTGIFSLSKK